MENNKKRNNAKALVTTKKNSSKELLIAMSITACACLTIGGLVGALITTGMTKGNEEQTSETTMQTIELTKESDINSAIAELDSVIDYVMSEPAYIEVQVSDSEFDRYLYNSKGEAAVQSSSMAYTVVFMNDGNSIRCNQLDEQLEKNTSIDIITTASSVISGIKDKKNGFSMSQILYDEDDGTVKEYVIETKGIEACKDVYRVISDDYANTIIDTLVEYISEMESIVYDPIIRYGFIFADDNSLNMYCEIMVNGISNINWYCTGYIHTEDWELSEEWYETDFTEGNIQKIMDMTAELSGQLSTVLHNAVDDEAASNASEDEVISGEESSEASEIESSESSDTSDESSDISNEDSSEIEEEPNNSSETDGAVSTVE